MADPALLPDPTCLHLLQLEAEGKVIIATVKTTAPDARCPVCASRSEKVHSRYVRVLADLPWMSCAVRLALHTRRFFCLNPDCQRKIFTERLPNVVAPYAHRTLRLAEVFTLIGFALGGEAGKRLAGGMGLATSPDTLLRLLHAQPVQEHLTPRILGVDDFSFLRARSFGAILIDLEKRIPVDVLPDRDAETFAKWLLAHPGVELISRDRGGSFAEGGRSGAPQAVQCADRFHLLVNLSETLEALFLGKRTTLKAVHDPADLSPAPAEPRPARLSQKGTTKKQEAKSEALHQQRVERYEKVHELKAKKADIADMARELDMARRTVYHYLKMDHPPERIRVVNRRGRSKKVAPYQEYLIRRWNEGCRNASQLYRELTEEQGYTASYANVERFLMQFRTKEHKFKQEGPAQEPIKKPPTTKRPPTAKQVSRWITLPKERRLDWQNTYLERLLQADPVIAQVAELMVDFATMLRERGGERLDEWLAKVEQQEVAELKSFAQGL
ncbi:MAG: ISL3 family transposase, partial [Ktedonobacteraceae bacterium]|nr:ISL3 family transposase [Ktedonobacteraceae bacterium]